MFMKQILSFAIYGVAYNNFYLLHLTIIIYILTVFWIEIKA